MDTHMRHLKNDYEKQKCLSEKFNKLGDWVLEGYFHIF